MERVRERAGAVTLRRGDVRVRRLLALALLTSAMSAVGVSSASAVIVKLSSGKTVSYQPLHGVLPAPNLLQPFAETENLAYHGGPVMTSNTNYTFYWAPSGSPAYPAGYQAGVNKYLEDLAHDSGGNQNVDSVATQYTNAAEEKVKYKSTFAGAIIDTDPYPENGCTAAAICLTDTQIQTELRTYVNAHALPKDLLHEYFVLTPPGVESCFSASSLECSAGAINASYCAYHGYIPVTGGNIIYANDPYVGENPGCDSGQHPNNNLSDSAIMGGLSHEHNESITDPKLNAYFAASGEENGDKCRTFAKGSEFGLTLGYAPDGSPYNQVINGAEYYYQQEWSNVGVVCKQRTGIAVVTPAVTKLTPTAGPAAGGTTVTITGTGFVGASSVKFGSTPAASFKVKSWTTITAITPPGTSGTVDVTVTVPGGTSPISSADHYRFQPPTVTGVSPNSGPIAGGTSVTITGSGFALGSATTIKFAGITATGVECASTSVCTVVAPPHAKPVVVDVQAIANGFGSPKNIPADQFTYF